MTILLPVDGSTCSVCAARYATRHLIQFGKRPDIILVPVDPPALGRRDPFDTRALPATAKR